MVLGIDNLSNSVEDFSSFLLRALALLPFAAAYLVNFIAHEMRETEILPPSVIRAVASSLKSTSNAACFLHRIQFSLNLQRCRPRSLELEATFLLPR